jgi:nucleoside-diphosphate-sugar epimerase
LRVLVTGHEGYIGVVLTDVFARAGHEVVGLDAGWYRGCTFGAEPAAVESLSLDLRDVEPRHLEGFDAVVHLAAISNDPLADLDPETTYDVNHRASVRLARLAKRAGVGRFVFSSSCSLYGTADPGVLVDEDAPMRPITPYGESKVLVERDVSALADDHFSPVFLRNATVYGVSPRLRLDLVVNNLAGFAFTTGEVLVMSDGTPWRPLVHIEDVCRAFLAVVEAPRAAVHDEAFNVGRSEENHQVSELADIVARAQPGSRVVYAPGGGPDPRTYRVDFSKLSRALPDLRMTWAVEAGVEELVSAYAREGLSMNDVTGPRYTRIRRIQELKAAGRLDGALRWDRARAQARAMP